MANQDIRCPGCDKLCGRYHEGYVEIIRGGQTVRIYDAATIVVDCPGINDDGKPCGKTFDISGRIQALT